MMRLPWMCVAIEEYLLVSIKSSVDLVLHSNQINLMNLNHMLYFAQEGKHRNQKIK